MKTIIKHKFKFITFIVLVTLYIILNRGEKVTITRELPLFTKNGLLKYNGDNSNEPVYIAYDGYVYDVTNGRDDFYNPGMPYHYLTGKDSTFELNIAGGDIIKRKYQIVGKYIK